MHHWKTFYVCILTNELKSVLYVGMTNNLDKESLNTSNKEVKNFFHW